MKGKILAGMVILAMITPLVSGESASDTSDIGVEVEEENTETKDVQDTGTKTEGNVYGGIYIITAVILFRSIIYYRSECNNE